jgi:hypothetical protein
MRSISTWSFLPEILVWRFADDVFSIFSPDESVELGTPHVVACLSFRPQREKHIPLLTLELSALGKMAKRSVTCSCR